MVKIDVNEWYDAIEAELEASGGSYEEADESVYRHFKKLHRGAALELPSDQRREEDIRKWLEECGDD